MTKAQVRSTTTSVAGLSMLAGLVGFAVAAVPACEKFDSFECGVEREGHTVVCDRPLETCICTTRKCAERVDTSVCSTGYRYTTRWPFHPKNRDGDCVAVGELALEVRDPTSSELCPGVVRAPARDASSDVDAGPSSDAGTDADERDAPADGERDATVDTGIVDARVDGAEGGDQ